MLLMTYCKDYYYLSFNKIINYYSSKCVKSIAHQMSKMLMFMSDVQYVLDMYLVYVFRNKCQLKKITVVIAIGSFSLG